MSALLVLSLGTGHFLKTAGEVRQAKAESPASREPGLVGLVADRPLATFQNALLERAFSAATALPIEPHIKDRSRAQEAVVAACLKLDQPRRALGYIEKIDNWRRGAGYADLAFYCAQHSAADKVQHYLDLAQQISDRADDENAQDWQKDRIRSKIAQTHLWLGQAQQAAAFEAGIVDSEMGALEAVRAKLSNANAFDQQIKELDGAVATGSFDQIRNALETYAQFFNRFYDDTERRARVEDKIKTAWVKVPGMVRVELIMELAESALNHRNSSQALDLLNEADAIVGSSHWSPEVHIPLRARLAGARYRSGDKTKALSQAVTALAMFDADREQIVNIYRAGALRPLAEAYQAMGDTATALTVYKKAIEEGVENPNSRPRAEDLSATCCSMALHAVEPDANLWTRIASIQSALGKPW